MSNMQICVDIDGTVTDPYYWLSDANRYFKQQLTYKDVIHYDFGKVLNVDRCDYNEFYYKFGETIHFKSEVSAGAKEVLDRLSYGHKIHFVTARERAMEQVSLDWLKKQKLPWASISLLGHSHKVETAINLNCDFFIEDSLNNALELSVSGFQVLLLDCNYNKAVLPKNIKRVSNWYQIENILRFSKENHLQLI